MFIDLLKKCKNIRVLEINSFDRNLKTILEECLPKLLKLENISLSLNAFKPNDTFDKIKKLNSNTKKINVKGNCKNI